MKRLFASVTVVMVSFLPCAGNALAQTPSPLIRLVEERCTVCHRRTGGQRPPDVEGAPPFSTLQKMTPESIYRALTTGSMRVHTEDLTDQEKGVIAEYLSGHALGSEESGDARLMPNQCRNTPPMRDLAVGPAWNGWGVDTTNGRFQQAAGLSADQVPRLRLKWAFGFPGASSVYGQPTIAGGRIFIGADTGYVYSLDAETGCVHWSFVAQAGVRTAIDVGSVNGEGSGRHAIYFGDTRANVYGVDAVTGALLWKVKVEEHPLAVITGTPTLHEGRLYVPVSSREEAAGASPNYPCCTFRGSLVALDAKTGRQIWKTYTIPDSPKPVRKNSKGTQLWSPAGVAIWSSPTIDVKHRAVYVATGDAYTKPAGSTSDAIMAIDMDTGKVLWVVQDTEDDAWLVGCAQEPTENCPEDLGPDYDFGAPPVLRTLPDGRRLLVAAQKSGLVFAHDPDRQGALVWTARLVKTLALGEMTFGGAVDDQLAYFGLKSGGVTAVRLTTGERKWFTPVAVPETPPRGPTAALTAIPGVVFSGGWDGVLRAFSTDDGRLLWQYPTLREFVTVNGVTAKGGSMGAPGPTIAGGLVLVGSGYVGMRDGTPGNVLLAFSVE